MLEIVLLFVVVVLLVVLFFVARKMFFLQKSLGDLRFSKASQSVKYGQLAEQWIPFSEKFPYNAQNFRFIGKPIDGICFEDDKIIFVEFKTNKSQMNDAQKRVKRLIEDKKVEWLEFRAD